MMYATLAMHRSTHTLILARGKAEAKGVCDSLVMYGYAATLDALVCPHECWLRAEGAGLNHCPGLHEHVLAIKV
jgi:hypothetical protein